jgi:hypothetical protein
MIYKLFGFDFFIDFSVIQLVIFTAILGNIFRLILSILHNQIWTRSKLQFLNFSFLPTITFIITKIISGNIALSLGMVGALSIVRLRTPVKNPFELVSYFFLITLGIIVSVNPNIAINFLIVSLIVSLLIELINKLILEANGSESSNFTDVDKSTLILNTNKKIDSLENNSNLKNISYNQNEYKYTLISSNVDYLNKMLDEMEDKDINSYFIENNSLE